MGAVKAGKPSQGFLRPLLQEPVLPDIRAEPLECVHREMMRHADDEFIDYKSHAFVWLDLEPVPKTPKSDDTRSLLS
jgi:hypothetical protein